MRLSSPGEQVRLRWLVIASPIDTPVAAQLVSTSTSAADPHPARTAWIR